MHNNISRLKGLNLREITDLVFSLYKSLAVVSLSVTTEMSCMLMNQEPEMAAAV